ncbi:MAG: FmdE family protein [Thermodesulfobacteriota bacterium]
MDLNLEIKDERLKETIAFHGHLCPGLLIGYRAALLGLTRLGGRRAEDEELVALVENDSCSVDAVQYLTGCTFGKGNFVFRDYGKQVFTLAYRPDGRGVRLAFRGDRLKNRTPDGASDRTAFAQALLEAADDDLFIVTDVKIDLPPLARRYPTLTCDLCGEGVMEPRLLRLSGRRVCHDCLARLDPRATLEQTADFLFEVGMLKKTPRTGYQFLGNGRETVAAHSFRVAVVGLILARLTPGCDADRTVKMCLLHDLAEARTGDHNYVNKQYVVVDEGRAIRDAASKVACGLEIEGLSAEFLTGETIEARLAFDADQLDMVVELKERMDLGNKYAEAWLYYARKRLKTQIGRDLHDAILKTDWTHWWFDRQDHLWVRDG